MATYLTKRKRKGRGKYSWTLTPPEDILEAGIFKTKTFHDGRTARMAERLLKKVIADFRAGKLAPDVMPEDPTFNVLVAHYLDTAHFNSLSPNSRAVYRRGFDAIGQTPVGNKPLGMMRLSEFSSQLCSKIYSQWIENNSVAWANEKKRLWGVLFSYAMSIDLLDRNPMANVKAVHHEPQTTMWTQEQVEKFLDVAFSDFQYRAIGLLVLLCYEWGQRPVDIANLVWSNLDFDTDTVIIRQKKRGATVQLPISPEIKEMLLQQKEDFDFQEYVLPYLRGDNAWRPMTSDVWSTLFRKVAEEAGLPEELQVRGLRTTAITEMVEAGVDSVQIKQVSGHKSINSLNPYIKNSRRGAAAALSSRAKLKTRCDN